MNKRVYAVILAVVMFVVALVCVVLTSIGTSKLTVKEAKAKLLELMADDPNIGAMEIWDEDINPKPQTINIKVRNGMRNEKVYNFSFRYNENMPGMEERLAGDYAISLDGKNVYWYDPVNNWHIDYFDRAMYNPGTGEWADN